MATYPIVQDKVNTNPVNPMGESRMGEKTTDIHIGEGVVIKAPSPYLDMPR
jgi:hypothetical protein